MIINMKTSSARPDLDYSVSGIGINYEYANSPSLEKIDEWLDLKTALRESMIEGYQKTAAENLEIAEEDMQIVLETWPQWEI